jgi:16S rRNA processing protein RimM
LDTRAAYVTVALILRPHGIKGEVAAEILTDFPERLKTLAKVDLYDPKLHTVANGVSVRSCWLSQSRGGQAIFHFEGTNSIDEAKVLVGREVQIPLTERVALSDGHYYVSDLVGCEVVTQLGQSLGRVKEVQFIGEQQDGTPNLAVASPNGEVLIPLAQDICVNIDTAARRVTVSLPEGLLGLNPNS